MIHAQGNKFHHLFLQKICSIKKITRLVKLFAGDKYYVVNSGCRDGIDYRDDICWLLMRRHLFKTSLVLGVVSVVSVNLVFRLKVDACVKMIVGDFV